MNIFAVFGTNKTLPVAEFIEQHYPSYFYKVKDGEWFVASNKTTNEITEFFIERLNPNDSNSMITFIIIPVSNWNGWSDHDIWEWLTLKSKEIVIATPVEQRASDKSGTSDE